MAERCSVKQIASVAEFKQDIANLPAECLAVIYFHASWAAPCKDMSTHLQNTAAKIAASNPPQISFLALEAEELADVSEEYRVTQVPCLVFQRDNKVLDMIMGTNTDVVNAAIDKHLGQPALADASQASLPPRQQVTRPPASTENRSALPDNGLSGSNTTNPSREDTSEETKEELNNRLSQLVKAASVMLFMKGTPSAPQCGFSRQTVAILREHGVKYGFFNILADDGVRQGLKEFSEWPTFPQVYVDGEFVGGLDILKEEFENDPEFLKGYSVNKVAA